MYTVEYQQISSLSQVDFDTLFYASLVKMEPSFSFPAHYTSVQKRDMMYNIIQEMIDGNSPLQGPGEILLMHKVVLDSVDASLVVGFIEADPTIFRNHWFFVAPDSNGSKSWLYSAEYKQALSTYYASKGITSFRNNMRTGTPIHAHVLNKQTANDYSIVAETIEPLAEPNAISCIINVP